MVDLVKGIPQGLVSGDNRESRAVPNFCFQKVGD